VDRITWQPGESGKGIVDQNGDVHVWNDDDYELHRDYIDTHPDVQHGEAYFYVEPDGGISLTMPNKAYDGQQRYEAMLDIILEADPYFHEVKDDWRF
jgi:hypothetical protein